MSKKTLALEGKIFDKVRKIIELPQGHVYDQWLADMKHNRQLIHSVISTKADDTRNLLHFHFRCLAEIRKMHHYPTGENLPGVYWRTYFMDNQLKLPAEVGRSLEEHIGMTEAEMETLENFSRQSGTCPMDKFHIIPCCVSITTWNLSKVFWKPPFLPNFLALFCRFLLSTSVTFVAGLWLERLNKSFVAKNLLQRCRSSLHFPDKHLERFTNAQNNLSGRNFCVTDTGHVGWVSRFAKKGDEICVFRGSRFPFIIHKVGACHSRTYRLRGDCYIHGLMGENLFEKAQSDVENIRLV